MFLSENYILANELVSKMNVNIANVSMIRQKFEDENDLTTIIKMNSCNFIKSNSSKLPQTFQRSINSNTFTDFTNKLPCTWLKEEFNVTEREWFNSKIVTDKVKLYGKEFYVFSEDFIKKVKNRILYVLDKEETQKCYQNNQIEGYIQLSNNKFMTWYDPKVMVQRNKK